MKTYPELIDLINEVLEDAELFDDELCGYGYRISPYMIDKLREVAETPETQRYNTFPIRADHRVPGARLHPCAWTDESYLERLVHLRLERRGSRQPPVSRRRRECPLGNGPTYYPRGSVH